MLRLLCFRVFAQQCVVFFCGPIIKNLHLERFVSRSMMLLKNGSPKGSSASVMYAKYNICSFETTVRQD